MHYIAKQSWQMNRMRIYHHSRRNQSIDNAYTYHSRSKNDYPRRSCIVIAFVPIHSVCRYLWNKNSYGRSIASS